MGFSCVLQEIAGLGELLRVVRNTATRVPRFCRQRQGWSGFKYIYAFLKVKNSKKAFKSKVTQKKNLEKILHFLALFSSNLKVSLTLGAELTTEGCSERPCSLCQRGTAGQGEDEPLLSCLPDRQPSSGL